MEDTPKFCYSCGGPLSPGARFCASCGQAVLAPSAPLPASGAPQAQPAPAVTVAAWSGWKSVGAIALVGGIISVVAFFISWLTTPAINLGGTSIAGQINGWALFRAPFDVLGSLGQSRGGNFSNGLFGYLSGQMQLFLIVYLIDSVLLILTPILGSVIAVNSWQMLQSADAAAEKARQRRNKRLAIVGLVPPIVLMVLVILLVAALSNTDGRPVDLNWLLRIFDIGYWLTLGALLLVILAGPLAAPKQR
jgi:hypothetical protein